MQSSLMVLLMLRHSVLRRHGVLSTLLDSLLLLQVILVGELVRRDLVVGWDRGVAGHAASLLLLDLVLHVVG